MLTQLLTMTTTHKSPSLGVGLRSQRGDGVGHVGRLVEEDQAHLGPVRQVVHDKLFASRADKVPVVAHVHGLRVLEDDDVLGGGGPGHREAGDGEVDGGARRGPGKVGVGGDNLDRKLISCI